MSPQTDTPILSVLQSFADQFNERLEQFVEFPAETPDRLLEAMLYSLLAPGKRLRPFLVDRCCRLVGGSEQDAMAPGAAIEMVHAFSLVHDDLPAMDDDDLRRGRPTNHVVFGEAMAVLAGDALLTLAFTTLAERVDEPAKSVAMVRELALRSGCAGMIGGQAADVLGEESEPERGLVAYIDEHKTADMFAAACRLGAIAGGGTKDDLQRLESFALQLGLAFQITDDLLDETATAPVLGKGVRKDREKNKQTFPACVGIEQSRSLAADAIAKARESIAGYGEAAAELRALADYVLTRGC